MALTTKEFMQLREDLNQQCERLLSLKGAEYAQADITDDRLNNFTRVAERVASTPLKVLATYLIKHEDSIEKYIRTGREGTDEGIQSRIVDARNYLDLLYGMVEHDRIGHAAQVVTGLPLAPGSLASKRCTCNAPGSVVNMVSNAHYTYCEMYSAEVPSDTVSG